MKKGRDSHDTHLNSVKGRVIKALMDLSPFLEYMDLKTRREVVYAKAGSIALYGAELYVGQTEWTLNRLTAILMRCDRSIFQKDWYRVSNRRICSEILVDLPITMCRKACVRFFHKMIWTRRPNQLYEKLKFNNRHRDCSKIYIMNPLRKQVSKRTLLYSGLDLYNTMPIEYKLMDPKKLKKEINKMNI